MLSTITAYICCSLTCKNAAGLTPTTKDVACPRNIPLHTKIIINNKEYECHDRTHKRFDGRYDIFMGYGKEAHNKAIKFGKQKLKVIIK